jgi:hypothetical protein
MESTIRRHYLYFSLILSGTYSSQNAQNRSSFLVFYLLLRNLLMLLETGAWFCQKKQPLIYLFIFPLAFIQTKMKMFFLSLKLTWYRTFLCLQCMTGDPDWLYSQYQFYFRHLVEFHFRYISGFFAVCPAQLYFLDICDSSRHQSSSCAGNTFSILRYRGLTTWEINIFLCRRW